MPYSYRDTVVRAARAVQVIVMGSKQLLYQKDEQSVESSVTSVSDGRETDNHETIMEQGIFVVIDCI